MSYLIVAVAAYFVGEYRAEVWAFLSKWAEKFWAYLHTTKVTPEK